MCYIIFSFVWCLYKNVRLSNHVLNFKTQKISFSADFWFWGYNVTGLVNSVHHENFFAMTLLTHSTTYFAGTYICPFLLCSKHQIYWLAFLYMFFSVVFMFFTFFMVYNENLCRKNETKNKILFFKKLL